MSRFCVFDQYFTFWCRQDVRYLKPHVEEVVKEDLERVKWDNIEVKRTR